MSLRGMGFRAHADLGSFRLVRSAKDLADSLEKKVSCLKSVAIGRNPSAVAEALTP